MLRKFALVSGLVVAAGLMPSTASAGVQSPLTGLAADRSSIVQQAQWWEMDRCRVWRHECAERWGWGSPRWYRCLSRHACERHRYGDRWDRPFGDRWFRPF